MTESWMDVFTLYHCIDVLDVIMWCRAWADAIRAAVTLMSSLAAWMDGKWDLNSCWILLIVRVWSFLITAAQFSSHDHYSAEWKSMQCQQVSDLKDTISIVRSQCHGGRWKTHLPRPRVWNQSIDRGHWRCNRSALFTSQHVRLVIVVVSAAGRWNRSVLHVNIPVCRIFLRQHGEAGKIVWYAYINV